MESTKVIQTSYLGLIQGTVADKVVQFSGLPYASLRDRLAVAELVRSRPSETILDATQDGPTALSPPDGCEFEQKAIQHDLPSKRLRQSDCDCLNLNVTSPEGCTSNSDLPVFLFIHGGGYVMGANSWPQFDMRRFVRLSVEGNKPIVVVSINYRLGVLGFFTSKELRDAGYKPNNGIRDQRIAIQWVHRHIKDFGGDPKNITVAGMSAGGASALLHLHSGEPLFQRAISMSGTPLLLPPLSFDEQERSYQEAMKYWGLSDKSPEERLRFLLECPADMLLKLPPSSKIATTVDYDLIAEEESFNGVKCSRSKYPLGKVWCQDILIGDASADSSIIAFVQPQLNQDCTRRFTGIVQSHLPESEARILLEDYHILNEPDDDGTFRRILECINDITFHAPAVAFAQGWPGNAYLYYFNEGNPWKGPYEGQTNHLLDTAYVFQNYSEYLSADQNSLAVSFARDIFYFCYGISPWPKLKEKEVNVRTYGPTGKGCFSNVISRLVGETTFRRTTVLELLETVSWEVLSQIVSDFRSGI